MKHFSHMDASSASEASKNLKSGKAWAIAGGTDIIGTLKDTDNGNRAIDEGYRRKCA